MGVHQELQAFFDEQKSWDFPRFTRFWNTLVETVATVAEKPDQLKAFTGKLPENVSTILDLPPEATYQHGLVHGALEVARRLANPLITEEAQNEMGNPTAQLVMQALKDHGPMHGQRIAREVERDPSQIHRLLVRMEERGVLQHQLEGRRKIFSPTSRGLAAWKAAQVRDGDW